MKKALTAAVCLLVVFLLAFTAAAAEQKKRPIKFNLKSRSGQHMAELFVVLPVADPLGRPQDSAKAMAFIQKHFARAVRAGFTSPQVAKSSLTVIGYLAPYRTPSGGKSYSRMHMLAELKIPKGEWKGLKASSLDQAEVNRLLKKYRTYLDQRRLGQAWKEAIK